ncbi:MAG: hypothetical protein ACPGQL_02885 [Thermoplasmatota archaeon]
MPPEAELRGRILQLVDRYPGLHLREIQRRMECSAMLAEYHLNALENLDLVQSTQEGRYRVFFATRGTAVALSRADRRWLTLMRRPPILGLVLLLLDRGPLRPLEIAQALEQPTSTAAYQLGVCEKGGLVVRVVQGGGKVIALAHPERITELLRAHHPTPDLLADYGSLWQGIFRRPKGSGGHHHEATHPLPEAIQGERSSVATIYMALLAGPQTQKEICLETGLARRTVYGALRRLRALGLTEERAHLLDTRQTRFWLKDPPERSSDEGAGSPSDKPGS